MTTLAITDSIVVKETLTVTDVGRSGGVPVERKSLLQGVNCCPRLQYVSRCHRATGPLATEIWRDFIGGEAVCLKMGTSAELTRGYSYTYTDTDTHTQTHTHTVAATQILITCEFSILLFSGFRECDVLQGTLRSLFTGENLILKIECG